MLSKTRFRAIAPALGVAVAVLAVTAACSGGDSGTKEASSAQAPKPVPPPTLSIAVPKVSDSDKISGRPDISVASDGKVSSVSLTDPDGKATPGALLGDGKTWAPSNQLKYDTKYTVSATATKSGKTATKSSSFTTMSDPGGSNGVDLYVESGTVGVALPLVFKFVESIPDEKRPDIVKHLRVRTSKPVEGAWRWISSDEVHFRPKDYWDPGTVIKATAAIGGLDMGKQRYGKRDRTMDLKVGRKLEMVADGQAHTATVYQDGKLLRKIPASLGKPSTPSSSGTLVIMETRRHATFDSSTFGVPSDSPGGYKTDVSYVARLTWGGEFIHAAPWSVGDQGKRNVSHGCVNMSTANSKWFYNLAHPGDIVRVVNTSTKVKPNDGWTDWTESFETYAAKGSRATTQPLS